MGKFSVVDLAAKVAADPSIQRIIAKNLNNFDPALAARLRAGDPDAALEAYKAVVAAGGRLPARQMELPMGDGPPPNDLRPLFGDQKTWEGTGNIAARILGEGPRGMVPFGNRGPGVPVGGVSGPGVARGLSGPGVLGGQLIPSRQNPIAVLGPRGMNPVDAQFIPDGDIMVRPMRGEVMPRASDMNPYPRQTGSRPPSRNGGRIAAAGAGAGLVGLGYALRNQEESPADGVTNTSGTAELHAEQSPPPSVETPPEPTAEMYFSQARELIDRLNQMRRDAGGEVPEAPQIMAQVKRLQAMGDQLRNAPDYRPSDSGDPHQQAQMLIQDLNARRRQAGGEVPDAPRVMAEVRRLQAMGDQQKNSGYGRSMAKYSA